jgi:hypothetical protein
MIELQLENGDKISIEENKQWWDEWGKHCEGMLSVLCDLFVNEKIIYESALGMITESRIRRIEKVCEERQ